MEKEPKINWEQDFFVHHRIVSAIKRTEFVSDRMLYIVLRGHWCNIFALNVHAPSEEKSDDSKDSFYEEVVVVIGPEKTNCPFSVLKCIGSLSS
jgi:hypothetical protein